MWNNTAISNDYRVHKDVSLQDKYALRKWDVTEEGTDHKCIADGLTLLDYTEKGRAFGEMYTSAPEHMKVWFGLSDQAGRKGAIGGPECIAALTRAPAMFADLALVRAQYGASQLTPLEAYDAVRLLMSELMAIMEGSAPASAAIRYCQQVLHRLNLKLVVSEEAMIDSTQNARSFLPHKGQNLAHNDVDFQLIKFTGQNVGSKTELLQFTE